MRVLDTEWNQGHAREWRGAATAASAIATAATASTLTAVVARAQQASGDGDIRGGHWVHRSHQHAHARRDCSATCIPTNRAQIIRSGTLKPSATPNNQSHPPDMMGNPFPTLPVIT